jgi:small-conductance mechanosensitive channel
MNKFLRSLYDSLPDWAASWFDVLVTTVEVVLIAVGAWLAMRLASRLLRKVSNTYLLPAEITALARRVVAFVLYGCAVAWALERVGVSGAVLWAAFTGFATVGAVAFFAVWSVLSNLFCALLIYTTRAFRVGDLIELLESGDKPGVKGQVIDINLVYTTLHESGGEQDGTTLQLPNSLFFQRILRRWHGSSAQMRDRSVAT